MATTNYQQTGLSQPWTAGSSAMASLFQFGNSDDVIRDLGFNWKMGYTFDNTIMSFMGGGTPLTTSDPTGKFIIPFRNREDITGTSAGVSASGTNLIVTLTNATEVRFRNGDVIFDGLSKAAGYIISGGGTNVLTIEPLNGFTFSASTMFLAGSFITKLYDMSAIDTSTGKVSLYTGFNEYSDYCLFMRDNVKYNQSDKLTVLMTAPDGAKFMYKQATVDTMARLLKDRATAMIYGKSAYQNTAFEGWAGGYRGMRDAIIAEGFALQQSTALTEPLFRQMAMEVADNIPDATQRLTMMSARQALANVQAFYPTQIVQPPVVTQLAGKELGALAYSKNIQSFKFAGMEVDWVYSSVLQDKSLLGQQTTTGIGTIAQNSIYMFTLPTIPSITPEQNSSQFVTRVVPTWSSGEMEVSTTPGAFSKIIKNSDGSWMSVSGQTGWTEQYGRTEGYHFQGILGAMYEPTV